MLKLSHGKHGKRLILEGLQKPDQLTKYSCWAAVGASVFNYAKGASPGINQLQFAHAIAGKSVESPMQAITLVQMLNKRLGTKYTSILDPYDTQGLVPWKIVATNLMNNIPVIIDVKMPGQKWNHLICSFGFGVSHGSTRFFMYDPSYSDLHKENTVEVMNKGKYGKWIIHRGKRAFMNSSYINMYGYKIL